MNPPSTLDPRPSTDLAAIYRRVSTDRQDDSLELQEKKVRDYAAFKNLTISEGLTFSDPDTSGRTPILDRTGGRGLINRLKHGDVQHLIVAKLDRLGRNVRDGLSILEFLKERQVTLHIVDLGGESISTQGHVGRFMLTLLLAIAEWERQEITDRTQKQMDHKFAKMELTGNVPYGYDAEYRFQNREVITRADAAPAADLLKYEEEFGDCLSKLLIANTEEQNIIRRMKDLKDRPGNGRKNTSYTQVAKELNILGYKTKQGHPWTCGNVASVLNSRHTKRLLQTPAP